MEGGGGGEEAVRRPPLVLNSRILSWAGSTWELASDVYGFGYEVFSLSMNTDCQNSSSSST